MNMNAPLLVDMILAAVVTVFVVDLSGFTTSWKTALARWLHVPADRLHVKPFDCALCMTFWVSLGVSLVRGEFCLLAVVYAALLAFFSSTIADTLRIVKDAFTKIGDLIYKHILK